MCIRDSYRAEGPRPLRVGGIESAIRKAASMGDGTTLLFGLDGFRVVSVTRSPIGVRQVLIEGVSQETGLPELRGVQHPGARPVDPTGQGPALRRTGGSVLGQASVRLRRRQLPTPDVHRGQRPAGPAPAGVRWLGVDETRVCRVRWLLEESGWKRSDPWMTSFVDLDPTRPAGLLGLAPGRSGAAVTGLSTFR